MNVSGIRLFGLAFAAAAVAAVVLYFGVVAGGGTSSDETTSVTSTGEPTATPAPMADSDAEPTPVAAPKPSEEPPLEELPLEEFEPVGDLVDECEAWAGQEGEFSAECQAIHDDVAYRCDVESDAQGLVSGFCWPVESTEAFCRVTFGGVTEACSGSPDG